MTWHDDYRALKRAREEVGISQAALARAAGVKRSLIANIETGRRPFAKGIQHVLWTALARVKTEKELRAQALDKRIGEKIKLSELLDSSPAAFNRYRELLRHQYDERALASARTLIGVQDRQIVELRAEVERLEKQNKALREWLESEETAALAHEKATDLKERVSSEVKGE